MTDIDKARRLLQMATLALERIEADAAQARRDVDKALASLEDTSEPSPDPPPTTSETLRYNPPTMVWPATWRITQVDVFKSLGPEHDNKLQTSRIPNNVFVFSPAALRQPKLYIQMVRRDGSCIYEATIHPRSGFDGRPQGGFVIYSLNGGWPPTHDRAQFHQVGSDAATRTVKWRMK